MSKMTKKDWEIARLTWEEDPNVTYSELARHFGTTAQNIGQKSRRDGWTKRSNGLARHNDRAHERADSIASSRASTRQVKDIKKRAKKEREEMTKNMLEQFSQRLDDGVPCHIAIIDAMHSDRVAVIEQHRLDAIEPRKLLVEAMRWKDPDQQTKALRHAGLVADTLAKVHAIERKAWGLDVVAQEPKTIVIERTGGKEIAGEYTEVKDEQE